MSESARRPVQEEFPADKLSESARRPVQEHSPASKSSESVRRPVQEKFPADKLSESAWCPVQEEFPADKLSESARRPVQEEFPADKLSESACRPVQEHSPANKSSESARRPVQEKFPADKLSESARCPVQEEFPADKLSESARRPVQEQSPVDKSSESARRPVQEKFPADKLSESARRPVQEEFPADKLSESARRLVQEEHPVDKSNLPSLASPVQEECPRDKSNVSSTSTVDEKSTASLLFSVPEQNPAQKTDGQINSSHMSNQTRTEGGGPSRSSTGERVANSIVTVDNAATGTVDSVRDNTVQEGIAPLDAVEASEDSSTASNAVPKAVQDRLLQEVNCSPSSNMFGLDPLLGALESPLELSGNKDDAPHRVSLAKSSGASLLVKTPEKPKSPVEPSSVPKSIASSNAAGAGPHNRSLTGAGCGSSSSSAPVPTPCSKESPHRKAQHSREDAIPDSILPAGAVANVNQSMRNACNGEVSRPCNHHGGNPVGTSLDNLSSGPRSSADGQSTVIQIKDDNPEKDLKGQERCEDRCRFM